VGELIGGFNGLLESLSQRETALRKSEKLLRESQQAASIGSYSFHLETGTFDSTSTLDEIFGITKDYPHTNEAWVRFTHPDFMQAMHAALVEPVKNEKLFDAEYKIIRPNDGIERWMHCLGQIAYDDCGNAISLIGTVQDITERKQAERATLESAESYRTLVEWSPEPLAVHRDGKLLYVNPAATAMFGARSAQDLRGKPILELVHPDFHQIVLARVREQGEKGIAVPMMEEKFLKLDATPIDVEVQSRTILYQEAQPFRWPCETSRRRKRHKSGSRHWPSMTR
jgi:PAS domain S-box-containing protein